MELHGVPMGFRGIRAADPVAGNHSECISQRSQRMHRGAHGGAGGATETPWGHHGTPWRLHGASRSRRWVRRKSHLEWFAATGSAARIPRNPMGTLWSSMASPWGPMVPPWSPHGAQGSLHGVRQSPHGTQWDACRHSGYDPGDLIPSQWFLMPFAHPAAARRGPERRGGAPESPRGRHGTPRGRHGAQRSSRGSHGARRPVPGAVRSDVFSSS